MITFSARIFLKFVFISLLSLLNLLVWFYLGKQRVALPCTNNNSPSRNVRHSKNFQSCRRQAPQIAAKISNAVNRSACAISIRPSPSTFHLLLTSKFVRYKQQRLINLHYPDWTVLMTGSGKTADCQRVVNPFVSFKRKFSCFVLVRSMTMNVSSNLIRYDQVEEDTTIDPSIEKLDLEVSGEDTEQSTGDRESEESSKTTSSSSATPAVPEGRRRSLSKEVSKKLVTVAGFFHHVANDNSRHLLRKKFYPLLDHFSSFEQYLREKLWSHQLFAGSTLLVMVVNAGELDLLANFLCSCAFHKLTMNNIVVFTTSADVLPILHGFGVIGVFHEDSFAYAADAANEEYLDKTFIDMMWYKSFSVWFLLHLGYHVLFQDVDIIWFRDPFEYFSHTIRDYQSTHYKRIPKKDNVDHIFIPDAILSDDGQRSIRYTPFYANSGFYYFTSNPLMISISWKILTAFDLLHISGSHQNIFTMRLLEGMDLIPAPGLQTLFLPMNEFPSGVKFSHDRPYMQNIANRFEHPYIFHMCWTRNKYHKLQNFRSAKMWYVTTEASSYFDELGNINITIDEDHPKRHKHGPKRQSISLLSSLLSSNSPVSASSLTSYKALLKTIIYLEERNVSNHMRWKSVQKLICANPHE